MESFKKIIEVLESAYPFEGNYENAPDRIRYYFKSKNDDIRVDFDSLGSMYALEFRGEAGLNLTDKGDAYKVFGTIMEIVRDFMRKMEEEDWTDIVFHASKHKKWDDGESKRPDLYRRMIKRFGQNLDVRELDDKDSVSFIIKKPEIITEAKIPKRYSKFGVGKLIGGFVYFHKKYIDELPEEIVEVIEKINVPFEYTIIKYRPKDGQVSLIESPDFDENPEPTVGRVLRISPEGEIKVMKANKDPWIYHHKWLMVKDDYTGFDVEENKARSEKWMAFDDIDYSRIGKQSHWKEKVLPRL